MTRVLACGAWLKNRACLLDDDGVAHWSPDHGDLGTPQACRDLEAWLRRQGRVDVLAHDLHPDFFSSRIAQTLARELGVPAVAVQHHHAHIGVVMAEHALKEPVIGLALDGIGHGTDGTAWGGELLWVDADGDWQRLGGLWPLRLPGGDVGAREPWRVAAAALHELGRGDEIETRFAPHVGAARARGVQRMLAAQLNCPPTSSAGRWFDAAAAALDLSVRQEHEAQAAMALEALARAGLPAAGKLALPRLVDPDALQRLDIRPLLTRLLAGTDAPDQAAAWFHLALAQGLADWAHAAAVESGVRTVALGGGCFYNAILREQLTRRLQARGLRVLTPDSSGCGDAGLAFGQAWVAARVHQLQESLACA